jgi:toxin ParE1/3/4
MALPVVLLEGAVEDASEAYAWYRERSAIAADGFMAELDVGLAAIEASPERWPPWLHGTHRFLMKRYPYFDVYRIQDTAIWIVAVAHARRRPNFWKPR